MRETFSLPSVAEGEGGRAGRSVLRGWVDVQKRGGGGADLLCWKAGWLATQGERASGALEEEGFVSLGEAGTGGCLGAGLMQASGPELLSYEGDRIACTLARAEQEVGGWRR